MLALNAEQVFDIVFAILFLTLLPVMAWVAHKTATRHFADALKQLETKGHVVDHRVREGSHKSVSLIWARLPGPVELTFQVDRTDFGDTLLEKLGKGDIQVGDPTFDKQFTIRSNQPERISQILTPEIRQRLAALPKCSFSTGSMDSLLGADYWPKVHGPERKVIQFWGFLVEHKVEDPAEEERFVQLGQDLAQRIIQLSPLPKA